MSEHTALLAQAPRRRQPQCGIHFARYQPSVYEQHWLRRVAGNPHCRGLMPDADGVDDWLQASLIACYTCTCLPSQCQPCTLQQTLTSMTIQTSQNVRFVAGGCSTAANDAETT